MKIALTLLFLAVTVSTFAVSPQFWEENSQDTFAAGDPQSVSINSDGEIVLAPQLKKLYEGSDAIIWKILADSKGNLVAATGNDGRILRIDAAGKTTVLLDTNELEVQAMVLDKNGTLYAATSPDGKIYRVKPDGAASTFFDPEDKYIWSLALDPDGNLYAGTGDQGKIYKIDPQGKGAVLVDTNESNITVLAWDSAHNLLAGSDRNGILYRVDSQGKAFVLYDSEVQQITSIYPATDGSIYFSAISSVPTYAPMGRPFPEATPQPTPQPSGQENPQNPAPDEQEGVVTVEVTPLQTPAQPASQPRTPGVSQLLRLTPDGFVETMYRSEDQILDITGYKDNQILMSTGKKSTIIAVTPDKKSTILLKSPEEQLTSLASVGGRLRIASANPGNIYELVEAHAATGTHFSDVKDAQTTSTWGQIRWKAEVPKGTTLVLSTRTGNTKTPDETWTAWQSAGSDPAGAKIENSRARFIQWKADLATTDSKISPILRSVSVAYLQQNLRPEVQSITLQPPGAVFRKAASFAQDDFAGVSESTAPDQDPSDAAQQSASGFDMMGATLGKREYRRGFRTITWNATDPNRDDLRYDVYFRADNEKEWKPLAKNLKDPVFAWDTETLPDGTYTARVVVNDSPSNPKELSLSNSKESQPFEVDNTAPRIEVVKKSTEKGKTILEVRATDQYSTITDMQYAINPGEWVVVFPVDLINDSTSESYRIEISNVPPGSSLVLKCTDRVRNTATIRYDL